MNCEISVDGEWKGQATAEPEKIFPGQPGASEEITEQPLAIGKARTDRKKSAPR